MIDALHPATPAPFSVEAFSCQKAGNARTEYEDAWAIRGSDSPTRCRVAVADGATESSFSALWAALLVESFVRGRSNGPDFFDDLGAVRRLWWRKIRKRSLPWYAAEKARKGAYAAFVGLSINAVNRAWRAVAIGDCCLFQVSEGVLSGNDILFFASDALAAWLLRRAEKGEPAWEWIGAGIQTPQDFELLVAQAREEGTRNDDMTLVRLTRRAAPKNGT